mmetsp:Transcript_19733/g.19842  ORF Transcript_19733/g.19842 Transcript_19733/m.19842 type:complete len:214 (+) Transcript_19733:106-747(+)|eukprot:CAMPEP_0182427828 /NCGR_PEP_ID=MMETSP1167-20130531/20100_1 /TAXON_ID=2988 /ORGANISM="Mallomonas Sp, Strain CCMP3275" /LENGTH=213 /DNA_ID=CAMNT_0024610359 /DNA_START=68 /DNA_END=709 /DNA_ORIENTATION=+
MAKLLLLSILTYGILQMSFGFMHNGFVRFSSRLHADAPKDEYGYLIKERDWFNGLSVDPGNSLADPRAVPASAKEFAEKVKSGAEVTLKETLDMIDKNYEYVAVSFSNGDITNEPNENTGSAKIFSFGLMTRMDEKAVLSLFGEVYRNLDPNGSDHQNIRNFQKYGWSKIVFGNGLAIMSKLQAYDDTESAMGTQSVIEADSGWDVDSDSWMP